MHDVAWRGMWICVRSKDAQKQLARTSLSITFTADAKTAEITSDFLFFSCNPEINHTKLEKCLLLFTTDTNILILLY